ncbi:MAG: prepilin-type N-terminal cleavage/methylation domain-containing protein [Geobacter sp.]|nr:prepilin-type N-terminal cleavage/methylation domain-containing protein [Geobacter sp.]
MNRNGFTLIEIAIVLVIIGLLMTIGVPMIGVLTKRGAFIESRETVKFARDALSGSIVKNGNFGAAPLMSTSPRTADAWGRNLLFLADDAVWGAGKNVCGVTTTSIKLKECSNDACSAFNTKNNIAFLIYSNGEDANGVCTGTGVCTGGAGTCIFPTCTGTCTAGVCSGGAGTCPTCTATPGAYCTFPVWQQGAGYNNPCTYTATNPAYQYDDIVQYVTLDEIRAARNCSFNISKTSLPDANVGTAYSATLQASGDGSATYTWSTGQVQGGCAAGSVQLVPASIGLCLNTTTGVISGTPTSAGFGLNNFTVTATNSSNSTASQAFTLNVVNSLAITNQTLPNAETGVAYSVTLNGTGGNTPYTWSTGYAQGTCPAGDVQIDAVNTGLCLDTASGLMTGAIVATPYPIVAGASNIRVTITDANAKSVSKDFTLNIADGCMRGGAQVINAVGNQWYRRNGGTCTATTTTNGITVYPGDTLTMFNNNACAVAQARCTSQTLTYQFFKNLDTNYNCSVGWTASAGVNCTFNGGAPY